MCHNFVIETLTRSTIDKKEIGQQIAGLRKPSFFIGEILLLHNVDKTHPFKRKIGHNLSTIIAKSRDGESNNQLSSNIRSLIGYL